MALLFQAGNVCSRVKHAVIGYEIQMAAQTACHSGYVL